MRGPALSAAREAGAACRGEFLVSRIRCKTTEQAMPGHAGRPLKMFDNESQASLDFWELARILDIVSNIRDHQLAMLDFDDDLPTLRHPDPQRRKVRCSQRCHRRVYRLFRISVGHRVEGIGPSRPLIVS